MESSRTFTSNAPSARGVTDATRTFGVYLNNNQKFLAHFSGGSFDTGITRYAQEYVDSDRLNASIATLRHDGLQTFRYAPGGREYYTTRTDASRALARLDIGYSTYGWFKGNYPMRVYAVRVYNRAITSEESALNHALDKMRYMGYAAEDAGLPPNYDVDGEFNVSLRLDVEDLLVDRLLMVRKWLDWKNKKGTKK